MYDSWNTIYIIIIIRRIYFFWVTITVLDLNLERPTDRGNFLDYISDSNLKTQIIKFGLCKPTDSKLWKDYSEEHKSRSFSNDYYYTTPKIGMKIPRQWLCFSVVMRKIYCETFWLFASRLNPKFKCNWNNGICDWQNLSTKIMRHEKSH